MKKIGKWMILLALSTSTGALAGQAEDIVEAEEADTKLFGMAGTAIYQYATEASEDTGNYELDLFGTVKVRDGEADSFWGRDARPVLGQLF